ncbi:MAG: glycosyltransferase [Candidatus Omnitrophica bacterium]|nr:glycosyltransferase [Candidatus Omnitrophota bacterium]
MKVLQILPALELGGVERGTVDLARALKARGEGAVVISSGGALVQELEKEGIAHYTLPVDRKSIFSLALIPKIVEIIEKERIDIVHARSRVPAWIAWFACRRTKVPFVTTCHGYYSQHLLSRVMGWGKRVIVPSRVMARHMIDHFHVSPDRISLIPRGVDLSEFSFHPEKYSGPAPKVFRVLNLGRFSPIKGQLEFLRAIHRVRQLGLAVEVWLAGSEGDGKSKYTKEIQKIVHQLGLQKAVKFLGVRRDVADLLKDADLLVLSSLVPESFGRVLIEAGAVGTACVASRLGGILDIIEDGKEGVLVPPGDEEAMSNAIFRLLTDRDETRQMAHRLQEKVKREFSLEQMTEKTLEVYREVKNEKKILVIKWGALGDVILAVPSLRMLRKKFPTAHIGLLVDSRFSSVVSNCPYLNEVIPIDRIKARSWIWLTRFAARLRREMFDISVDFQNTKRTHFLGLLAGIPERYGYRRGIFGRLLNHGDLTFERPDSPVRHQFRILSKLGVSQPDEKLELWPDPLSEAHISDLFQEKGLSSNGKLVGFAIGSSPSWPTKRWPIEYFQALSEKLVKELDCQIVLMGSSEDSVLAQKFAAKSEGVVNFVGKTNLQELVSLVKQLRVLVTGDTAPLHVGAALGIKTVALFGPTDPLRHVQSSGEVTVLSRRLPCQPCYSGKCTYSEPMACLRRIGVDEVFEAVRKHLAQIYEDSHSH